MELPIPGEECGAAGPLLRSPGFLDAFLPPPPQVVPVALRELTLQLGTQSGGPWTRKLPQNRRPHSHPQHTCFLAPPDAASLGAKNQPQQPELQCERPALCPWGSGEGACRFPLSRPSPQSEGSASHDWPRTYQL